MDRVKCYLLPSLPSQNPQFTTRWEPEAQIHAYLLLFVQKCRKGNFILIFPSVAFSYRLHGAHRRGSSQSWPEQGGVQWATPPERNLYCTEQVRGWMNALVPRCLQVSRAGGWRQIFQWMYNLAKNLWWLYVSKNWICWTSVCGNSFSVVLKS